MVNILSNVTHSKLINIHSPGVTISCEVKCSSAYFLGRLSILLLNIWFNIIYGPNPSLCASQRGH